MTERAQRLVVLWSDDRGEVRKFTPKKGPTKYFAVKREDNKPIQCDSETSARATLGYIPPEFRMIERCASGRLFKNNGFMIPEYLVVPNTGVATKHYALSVARKALGIDTSPKRKQ